MKLKLKRLADVNFGVWLFLALFVMSVVAFSFFFLRQDQDLEVLIMVTEREESKYSLNVPDAFYGEQLQVGDYEKNELGKKIAEILKVDRINSPQFTDRTVVKLKLATNYSDLTNTYSYQGQKLRVGDFVRLSVGKVKVNGYILAFDHKLASIPKQKYLLELELDDVWNAPMGMNEERLDGVLQEVADSIKVGDEIFDHNGNSVFKIEKIDLRPTVRDFLNQQGRYQQYDSRFKSGVITTSMTTWHLDGMDYWQFETPLQVGANMIIDLPNVKVPVRIKKIISVEPIAD